MGLGTLVVRPFPLLHPNPGRAMRRLETTGWQARGRDMATDPGLYLVTMSDGTTSVRAIAACVAVGSTLQSSGLLPHEAVHAPAVTRRMKGMRSARVDREPVLLTHPGGGLAIAAAARSPQLLLSMEQAGIDITVSRIDDSDAEIVGADLARRACLVADGHHRLAAASAHSTECGSDTIDGRECAMVSALIVDSDDTPLRINPIHRVLHRRGPEPLGADEVVNALRRSQPALVLQAPAPGEADQPAGIVGAAPWSSADLVVVDRTGAVDVWCPPDGSAGLPTTVHVVERAATEVRATSLRRLRETDRVTAMAQRRGTVTILLNALSHTEIFDVIGDGGLLPVKATSFEPKLPAGVLIRPLDVHW